MARRERRRGGRAPESGAANRLARVGELIRRVVAEELDGLDDERLAMVSITSVEVDRELQRAVVWFTTLHGDDDPEIAAAFAEHGPRLRRAVATGTRLRRAPELEFRADVSLRSAERIEALLRETADDAPVPDPDPDTYRAERDPDDRDPDDRDPHESDDDD